MDEYETLISLGRLLAKLKDTPRTGWVNNKIPAPESVADHSYGICLLSMVISDKFAVNKEKLLKMALLHDLAESITGDVVTKNGSAQLDNARKKAEEEREAMIRVLSCIGEPDLMPLFDEYESNKSAEARLLKQLDRLEMAFQALAYEREYGVDLTPFYSSAIKEITDPYLANVLKAIEKQRPAHLVHPA
jgi:5'-deoxynucleotidase YfbR-like HD superfamily hydrolase